MKKHQNLVIFMIVILSFIFGMLFGMVSPLSNSNLSDKSTCIQNNQSNLENRTNQSQQLLERTLGLRAVNYTMNGVSYPGDWIHINVEDRNYNESLRVCKHEIAHEIFARECSDDFDKCLREVMEK